MKGELMKRIGLWLLGLFIPIVLINAQDKDRHKKDKPIDITVRSDENLDIDFSEYKTFAFASNVDVVSKKKGKSGILNDSKVKSEIREAVRTELEGLGYEQDNNADLVVTFRIFDQPTTLAGFEAPTQYTNKEVRQLEDKRQFEVDAGTIFIQLSDREEGKAVWQGFASGLVNIDKKYMEKDRQMIREAVNLIFDQYNYRANEYVKSF
jgi:hypothetical protein